MVEYYIEAIDQLGRPQVLTLTAKNSAMADELARSQGLQPTLITHATSRQQEKSQARRSRRRQRQFSLVGGLLILAVLAAGAGLWSYIQQLQTARGLSIENIRAAANSAEVAARASGGDDELTAFARELFAAINLRFPGLLSRVNVRSDSTMFVHFTRNIREHSNAQIEHITRLLTQQLQEAFGSDSVTVLAVLDGEALADGRYSYGETTVNLHVADSNE